jgi:hypothetical protein
MERLKKESGESKTLTDDQKARIADIENRYTAKIAETRLGYDTRLAQTPWNERPAVQAELADAVRSLEERRDREKDAVWEE